VSQLNGEDDLVVAASYGTHQVLILPMLFEQLFHIAWMTKSRNNLKKTQRQFPPILSNRPTPPYNFPSRNHAHPQYKGAWNITDIIHAMARRFCLVVVVRRNK
jgi:hypothetical protein